MSTRLRRSIKAAVVVFGSSRAVEQFISTRHHVDMPLCPPGAHGTLAPTLPLCRPVAMSTRLDATLCRPAAMSTRLDATLCRPVTMSTRLDATLCRPATMSTRVHVSTTCHTRAHTAPHQCDASATPEAAPTPRPCRPTCRGTGTQEHHNEVPQQHAKWQRKMAKKGAGVRSAHSHSRRRTFVLGSRVESITNRSRRS